MPPPLPEVGAALLAIASSRLFTSTASAAWVHAAWAPAIVAALALSAWAQRRRPGIASRCVLVFALFIAAVEVVLWAAARAT